MQGIGNATQSLCVCGWLYCVGAHEKESRSGGWKDPRAQKEGNGRENKSKGKRMKGTQLQNSFCCGFGSWTYVHAYRAKAIKCSSVNGPNGGTDAIGDAKSPPPPRAAASLGSGPSTTCRWRALQLSLGPCSRRRGPVYLWGFPRHAPPYTPDSDPFEGLHP